MKLIRGGKRGKGIGLLLALAVGGLPVRAAVSDAEILTSIKKGSDYLLGQLGGGDHWSASANADQKEHDGTSTYGGQTSLALYALLHVGQGDEDQRLTPESKELAPVIKYVANFSPKVTYDAGFTINSMAFLKFEKDKSYKASMDRSYKFLMTILRAKGDGSFGYDIKEALDKNTRREWDNSTSQYGVLGLWAVQERAREMKAEIRQSDWEAMETHWRKTQNSDGGWGYKPSQRPQSQGAMSVAGLASMYITQQYTDLSLRTTMKEDKTFQLGHQWLTKNFDPNWNLYAMYGVERVGLATGLKFIGPHDWYREGAEAIVHGQKPDGSWTSDFWGGSNPVVSTSFALAFLARGRNPVLFNKLQYEGNTWNARSRDDANLTAYLSRQLENPFNWQIVNLKVPVTEMADAPVLMITGSTDPKFTDEDVAKLKQFVNRGGTIFSTADAGAPAFTEAIKKYAGKMVDNKFEFKAVRKEDPLYTLHDPVKAPPLLEALSNGVRMVWVHSPKDLGAAWHRNNVGTAPDDFRMPENLIDYVVGRDGSTVDQKIAGMQDPPAPGSPPTKKAAVARVKYDGNWDPEPGGWERMGKYAAADFSTDVSTTAVPADKLDAKATPLAHLTGTGPFTPSPGEIAGLRTFVQNGGTLFVDAAGGHGDFINSVQAMVKSLALGGGLEEIPDADPLLAGGPNGAPKIEKFQYSKGYLLSHGGRKGADLLGVKVNGRWGVIVSPVDVSAALVGLHTYGIDGYRPETARALVRNLVTEVGGK